MKNSGPILACTGLLLVSSCVAEARYDDGHGSDAGAGDAGLADGGSPDTGGSDGAGADLSSGESCTGIWVDLCMTGCGSLGTRTCNGQVFGPCEPPEEDCNGLDDDCDGNIDNDLITRACSSACGGGSETCFDGQWSGCNAEAPELESCNGLDDDCDSAVDEDLSQPCSTLCGMGRETCMGAQWVGCDAPQPAAEQCNGLDDDCDGQVDEALSRGCSTACGAGTETCADGAWGGCTAPAVNPEQCNGVDDDCDGAIDEGFQVQVRTVPMAELTAMHAPCTSPNGNLDVCMSAAHRWCNSALPCLHSGAGLISAGVDSSATVLCFGRDAVVVQETFAEVSAVSEVPFNESDAGLRIVLSGSNRYCQRNGYGAGIGPLEHSSGLMYVVCLPIGLGATEIIATSELRNRGCDPMTSQLNTLACSTAAHLVCTSMGYVGGFGPVEWNSTQSAVACFNP